MAGDRYLHLLLTKNVGLYAVHYRQTLSSQKVVLDRLSLRNGKSVCESVFQAVADGTLAETVTPENFYVIKIVLPAK